jgi:hypothetical protein
MLRPASLVPAMPVDGMLICKGDIADRHLTFFAVSPLVDSVGMQCFLDCHALTFVTFLPVSRLKLIGSEAFSGCSALCSLCIPASVEILSQKCFFHCSSLLLLTFESGSKLVRIDAEAFFGCSSLEHISLPAPVRSLGLKCFFGCSDLSSFVLDSGSDSSFGNARN